MAQPCDAVPQPGQHRLLELLAGVPEQGDFFGLDDLFTEQPLVVSGLRRSTATGSAATSWTASGSTRRSTSTTRSSARGPKDRAAARAPASGLRDLRRGLREGCGRARAVHVRSGRAECPRLPAPGHPRPLRRRSSGSRGVATRLTEDDYFRRPTASRRPRRRSSATTTSAGRRSRIQRADRRRSTPNCDSASCSAIASSILLWGAPAVYYGDEVGMIGAGRGQGRAPGHVSDEGGGMADRRTPRRATDRHRLVVRCVVPSRGRSSPCARCAEGCTRGALDRRLVRAPCSDRCARRQPDRSRRAPRIPRRVQRRRDAFERHRPDGDAGGDLDAPARHGHGGGDRSERPCHPLRLQPLSAVLYRAHWELLRRGAARLRLRASSDLYTDLLLVDGDSVQPRPAERDVRLASRTGTAGWRRLAVDDGGPYRAFLDPAGFKRGERVYVVAVARASDGTVSTSAVLTVTPRPR